MRNIRSEHTANLALAQANTIPVDMVIGLHFYKPVKRKAKQKRGILATFRAAFKRGMIGG